MTPVVFVNGTVWRGFSGERPAQCLCVADGKVVDARDAPSRIHVVDLGGATLLPGLVDSHCHLTTAASGRLRVDLSGCTSLEEALSRVREWARLHPGDQWVRGRGWDHWRWREPILPSREVLDGAVPDRPVWLTRRDGHSAWLNTLAMEMLQAPQDAPEDLLPRDEGGRPLGIVREHLMEELAQRLPPWPRDRLMEALRQQEADLFAQGIVGVHTVERLGGLALLESAVASGLTLRLWVMAEGCRAAEVPTGGALAPGGLKLFVDGSLGSSTAWMLADEGSTGTPLLRGPVLRTLLEEALSHHLVPCLHVIGDAAVREALDAWDLLGRPRGCTLRLEHVQHVDSSDVARLRGVLLSVQPCHLLSDAPLLQRLPHRPSRLDYAYRTMARAGGVLLMGTDFPIEPPDPWRNVAAALSRSAHGGSPLHPWEALPLDLVLWAYTASPAQAAGWEGTGVLSPGMSADLVVVSADPSQGFAQAPRVRLTMLRGEVVYTDGSLDLP